MTFNPYLQIAQVLYFAQLNSKLQCNNIYNSTGVVSFTFHYKTPENVLQALLQTFCNVSDIVTL